MIILLIYTYIILGLLSLLFVIAIYDLFDKKEFYEMKNKICGTSDISSKRLKIVKKVLGKDIDLNDLARMSCCLRHEADLQTLWFCMDGTEKGLRRFKKAVKRNFLLLPKGSIK